MSNSYNSNPVVITGTMASGWRSLQTLNSNQIGLMVLEVRWVNIPAAGLSFKIVDPITNITLLDDQSGTVLAGQIYNNGGNGYQWRDWQVTVLGGGTLEITQKW